MRWLRYSLLLIVVAASPLCAADIPFKDLTTAELRARAADYFKSETRKQQLADLGVAADYSGMSVEKDGFVWKYRTTMKIEDPEALTAELRKLIEDMMGQAPNKEPVDITDVELKFVEAPPAPPKPETPPKPPRPPVLPPMAGAVKLSSLSPAEVEARANEFFASPQRAQELTAIGVRPHFSGILIIGNRLAWEYCPVEGPLDETATESLKNVMAEMLAQAPNRPSVDLTGVEYDFIAGDCAPVAPPVRSLFDYPKGLTMPPELLFARLGYRPGFSVPMTPENCFDLAYACWIRGLFIDALALAEEGISRRNDARLQLLRGVLLLSMNRAKDAERVATDYQAAVNQNASFGLGHALERVNGPMRARFDAVVNYQLQRSNLQPVYRP